MGRKIVTSIRIDEKVFRKAKELGLNVSKVAENALIDMIKRIEGSETKKDCDCRLENENLVLRAGFEPASPARKAGILGRAILPEHGGSYYFYCFRINLCFPILIDN